MIPAFEFTSPVRAIFGCGRVREAGTSVKEWGDCCLVFTGSDQARAATLLDSLRGAGLLAETLSVHGEPTFDSIRECVTRAEATNSDVIVAIGGGSVIDTAKAVAMLMANRGDPLDYAEVIGRGLPVTKLSVPFVAIPTTAGAGAEATRNAVLVEPSRNAKVSLRSPLMLPRMVIIDPETTVSLSAKTTAATGMDALAQLIEPFVSIKSNPVTDVLCREGIARVAHSLDRACQSPDDLRARSDMSLAAWWSGMSLANAGLGAVHGFAAAIGGMCDAPHGLICARFLAPVCRANIAALRMKNREHTVLAKYAEVARLLTGDATAKPEDGVMWIEALAARLPLEKLNNTGAARLPVEAVVDAALKSSSMKGNPVMLNRDVLAALFADALKHGGQTTE